jgi:hypothetical protein
MQRGPLKFQLSTLPCHIDSNTNAGNWKKDKVEVFNTNYRYLAPEVVARFDMLILVNGLPNPA